MLEAFAGAGGISEALRMELPGMRAVGVELDKDACATAVAAGHERVQADVSMLDLRPYVGRVAGFCAGPPCQAFSAAGKQLGKLDRPRIERHIERIRSAGRWLHYSREGWHDPRSPLVLEVLRYALVLEPEWVILEQVPGVLPLWHLVGEVLADRGYSVDCGVLKAEQYGVPQTRKRAILAASRTAAAALPTPTHRAYRKDVPQDAGDPELKPWVSMAEVLGRGLSDCPSPTITAGGTDTGGAEPIAHLSRYVSRPGWVRFGQRMNACDWVSGQARNSGPAAERQPRTVGEPSYTIRANGSGSHPSGVQWVPEGRVSVQEAAVLQSFRADYPWQGSLSARHRQVGDAAPPVLMAAVLAALTKR